MAKMMGMMSGAPSADLLSGLKKMAPAASDASMKLPKASVNDDTTRSSVRENQKTLGPREA